jgi:hypothetical protein
MNKGQKKPDLYAVLTLKNKVWTDQECKTRHELNRLIKEAKEDNCEGINISIKFNKQ